MNDEVINRFGTKQRLQAYPLLVAAFSSFIVVLAAVLLSPLVGSLPPLFLAASAIAASAWLCGLKSGLITTLLSSLGIALFVLETNHSLFEKSFLTEITLISLIVHGVLTTLLFSFSQRNMASLEDQKESAEAAREQAEESNSLKRSFIANMSHEIRTPLSAILGYLDLLTQNKISAKERRTYKERLSINASSLTQLVSDLLDVADIEPSSFIANRRQVALPSFIQNIYASFAPLAREKGLSFRVQLRGLIPKLIETDPEQLQQILKHIVGNAIRYSERGLVELTVSASRTQSGRRELALIVSDQGPGIRPELRPSLFVPIPAREDTSQRRPSHGFGLSLARRLARGLGGDVKIAKSDRKGTTLLVTIDAGPVRDAIEDFDVHSITPPSETPLLQAHSLLGQKILVIDDSPDSSLLVSRMLKLAGAEVETANRAQEGIDKALQLKPDVTIMDIEMPEMDGIEATRRLRDLGFSRPIIALSAHVMREDRAAAEEAGANDYLLKPISRRALIEAVAHFAHISTNENKFRLEQGGARPQELEI
jgi:signal transduction histidine kinase/AmiR/NasT family two-component response regulator